MKEFLNIPSIFFSQDRLHTLIHYTGIKYTQNNGNSKKLRTNPNPRRVPGHFPDNVITRSESFYPLLSPWGLLLRVSRVAYRARSVTSRVRLQGGDGHGAVPIRFIIYYCYYMYNIRAYI